MPVHIYIISCASSLATTRNASGTNDAPNHSTFARSQLLPSLTRLFDGRSYWDLNVVLLSIGDSAAPRTLPPAVEVLMKVLRSQRPFVFAFLLTLVSTH